MQKNLLPINHQKLIKTSPVKLPFSPPYHLKIIKVHYAVTVSVFEADQLRNISIGLNSIKLGVDWQVELNGLNLGIFEIEDSDMVAVEELDDVLAGDNLVNTFGQFSSSDAGKYPVNFNLFVYAVVFE